MEAIGKVISVLPAKTGEGANGTWINRTFVIQTEEEYSHLIALRVRGNAKCDAVGKLNVGDKIAVKFNIDSREFKGNWYNENNCYDISTFTSVTRQQQGYQVQGGYPQQQMPQQMQNAVNMLEEEGF